MLLTAYFTNNGNPATGLTPKITIWDSDAIVIINSKNMTEIAGGFYKYDFIIYNEDVDYVIRADGGATLASSERYVVGSNELATVKDDTKDLRKVESNKWIITNNQLIIYDEDGTTVLKTFNLQDRNGNPTMRDVFRRVPV